MASMLDEDAGLLAAIRMSLDDDANPNRPQHQSLPSSDDVLLQQALAASLTICNLNNNTTPTRAASPVSHDQLIVDEEDETQAELMQQIEDAKRQASSSAKKRRKNAKKLAKRNKKNNVKPERIRSASINDMNSDELRSELRRLCVPLPWPKEQSGLSALLFSIVDKRSKTKNEQTSPIRSKSQRNSRKVKNRTIRTTKKKGAGRGQEPKMDAEVAPSTKILIENVDTDDLLMNAILAQSLRESQREENDKNKNGSNGSYNNGTLNERHLHQSLAMEEQKQLERAMEENMKDYERQLIFSSLDLEIQTEAEIQWVQHMETFNTTGGSKPTTDFIVSLSQDIVARRKREAEEQILEEENKKMKEEEQKLQARNSETREERAARFAAAYENRT